MIINANSKKFIQINIRMDSPNPLKNFPYSIRKLLFDNNPVRIENIVNKGMKKYITSREMEVIFLFVISIYNNKNNSIKSTKIKGISIIYLTQFGHSFILTQ
jgi:hypothetical protein